MKTQVLTTIFFIVFLCLLKQTESISLKQHPNDRGNNASDSRLKDNLQLISKLPNGMNLYSWTWNELAKEKLNLVGESTGVIAQEVKLIKPEAVTLDEDGFFKVDYNLVFAN